MATTETKALDSIISSRRALLLGGAALGAAALVSSAHAASTVTTYTDSDILNFALNLEYLEANFYYLAAFGTTIDVPNAASMAAGGPTAGIGIGPGTAAVGGGKVITTSTTNAAAGTAGRVPFVTVANASYANEIAIEEGKHVILLRGALGSAAVPQPSLDVSPGAFTTVANAAGIAGTFNPYSAGLAFLVGAYVFEDVGVTAYHGAAPLIVSSSILGTAASILAVEAYHSGIVRQSILAQDTTGTFIGYTTMISALRAKLALAANTAAPSPDDYGLQTLAGGQPTAGALGAAGTTGNRSQTADADNTNFIAFSRNTTQVLNIVTGGGATTAGTAATGVFFPAGMNGTFK